MNFLRRHWFIILVIGVAAAIRFTILAISQTHVHSDEAIIGLMAKHISEGRYFPFYMYGQPYNASAAGEAYLAAALFKIFGVNVVTLKSVIVLLSLGCLFLFYRMVDALFDRRTAMFSTLAFALAPSLLKWDFQVRGYSFYFLAIPILVSLFWRVVTAEKLDSCSHGSAGRPTRPRRVATAACCLFGLASGLSLWFLELSLTLNLALWSLLLIWRRMSTKQLGFALLAFLIGYAPAIIYNFAHNFANWRTVFLDKAGGSLGPTVSALTKPANLHHIFLSELPKFFGPDTVLWYYAERPWTGLVFYAIAATSVLAIFFPAAGLSMRIRALLTGRRLDSDHTKDLLFLCLTVVCFVPYLLAPIPTASYFLGGLFFLCPLIGRLLGRLLVAGRTSELGSRYATIFYSAGILTFAAMLVAGVTAMVQVACRNEIETLSLCDGGKAYCMTRISGADIAAVEQHLYDHHVEGAWTSVSFTYPLLFELRETIPISDAIFGWEHNPYPPSVPLPQPSRTEPGVFIMETESPMRADLERRLTDTTKNPPAVTQYGSLIVIEQR